MELSGSIIKKFLIFSQNNYFLIFQLTELSYISGNGNPKKLFMFQEVTFQVKKIKTMNPEKIYYILGNRNPPKIYFIFSKESFSYIPGNRNSEKRNN